MEENNWKEIKELNIKEPFEQTKRIQCFSKYEFLHVFTVEEMLCVFILFFIDAISHFSFKIQYSINLLCTFD